jgi:hypothetical protein
MTKPEKMAKSAATLADREQKLEKLKAEHGIE